MDKKQRNYQIRQQRMLDGLCIVIECGAKAGINKSDGQRSRYCDPCKAAIQERKVKERPVLPLGDRPSKPKYDYGKNGGNDIYGIDAPDYRDSKEFADYAKAIMSILLKAKHPLKIREIHEALGDKANRHWTCLALENPAIKENQGYIDTYEIRTSFVKDLRYQNPNNGKIGVTITPPSHKAPDSSSYVNRERITA